jgi:hypothetical protein
MDYLGEYGTLGVTLYINEHNKCPTELLHVSVYWKNLSDNGISRLA